MDIEQANALNEAIRAIGIRHRALAGALLAPLGLHPGQEVLLLELADGHRTQAQLAVASGCEPPTITHSVRKLEAAGLVVRRSSSDDGRVTIVELTEQGQAVLPQLHAAWLQLAEITIAQCATPLADLTRVLADLAHSLIAQQATKQTATDPRADPDPILGGVNTRSRGNASREAVGNRDRWRGPDRVRRGRNAS